MTYFLGWTALVVVSLWVSLTAFLWALKSGQFSDQGRARFLPFAGEAVEAPIRETGSRPVEVYALAGVATIVVLGMLAAVALSVFHMKG